MTSVHFGTGQPMNFTRDLYGRTLPSESFIEKPTFSELSMEFETLRQSSLTAETDAVEHLNFANNWTLVKWSRVFLINSRVFSKIKRTPHLSLVAL